MAGLPDGIYEMAERSTAEDMGLAILRHYLPDEMQIVSQIRLHQDFPVVLVRRLPTFIDFRGDERFLESMDFAIHTFAVDPDGDKDAAILAEATRVAFRSAWFDQFGNADLGWVKSMETLAPPRRTPDWATAQGPVQYADLPSNTWRYEGRYRLIIRKPRNKPYD